MPGNGCRRPGRRVSADLRIPAVRGIRSHPEICRDTDACGRGIRVPAVPTPGWFAASARIRRSAGMRMPAAEASEFRHVSESRVVRGIRSPGPVTEFRRIGDSPEIAIERRSPWRVAKTGRRRRRRGRDARRTVAEAPLRAHDSGDSPKRAGWCAAPRWLGSTGARGLYAADQPLSLASTMPLTLTPSSLSRKVIDAARPRPRQRRGGSPCRTGCARRPAGAERRLDVGDGRAGSDRVHADAARAVHERARLGEPDDGVLGRRVGGTGRRSAQGGLGGRVHDRTAALREHRGDDGARQLHGAGDVDAQDTLPDRVGQSPTGVMSSMIPAMLARPSIVSPAASMMRAMPSSSVMSAVSATTSAPACSATNSSRRSWLTSTAITRPPSRATRDAVARPMPEPAPVTMTVWPVKRPSLMRSVHSRSGTAATDASSSPSVLTAERRGPRPQARRRRRRGDELVEHLLREGAAAHLDQALDGEAADGLEHLRRLAALREHVGEDRVARRVVEPVGDRGVAREGRGGAMMVPFLLPDNCVRY